MFPMNMKTKPQKNKGSGDKPSDTVQVMIKKILNSLRRKDEQVKSFKKMLENIKNQTLKGINGRLNGIQG